MIKLDYNISYRKGKIYADDDILMAIRNHFSEKNESIVFVRRETGNNFIPDRRFAITATGMFDFGMYREIENYFITEQITDIEFTEEFLKRKAVGYGLEDVFDGLVYGNRDYGLDAIRSALSVGYGTIVVGTGGGKSYLMASLIENIWRQSDKPFKCLVIVPGLSLVTQLQNNFSEYGVNFTHSGWTGKTILQDTEIVICNSENFCSQFPNHKWIKNVDLVIVDEIHKTKSNNVISKHLSKIITAHRYGFTGTLPKENIDRWKIIGTFGPMIYEKNSKELRDENFLSDVGVRVLKLNYFDYTYRNYKKELEFLYSSEVRNDLIRKIVEKLNNNTLILVNRLTHGEVLLKKLQIVGRETFFVRGDMPVEERLAVIEKMENQTNIVCIAMSAIFSTGINISNLHYILFVAGGKSFIRTIQSVGRGLRLHESKSKLILFDFYDDMKYSSFHGDERKRFYDEEQIEWKETGIDLK